MSIMGNERRVFLENEAETEHLGRELARTVVESGHGCGARPGLLAV